MITGSLEIIGKYRIVAEIGQGATSQVYKAYDPTLDRHIAIKVITAEASGDPTRRRRFEREAQAAALLNHRNIVKVYEFGRDGDRLFIAMELLEGVDLRRAIAEGRLRTLDDKLDVLQQMTEALAFAHRHGIVHRDLKPANIHLLPDGQPKIMDFGLARLRGSDITRSGLVMGTPHYMSPEQVRGEHVDARSDVFSLGSMSYELISGQKPFDAETVHALLYKVMQASPQPLVTLCPGVPVVLASLLERAMSPAPADRFANAGELAAFLAATREAIAAGRGGEPLPGLLVARAADATRGRLRIAYLAALIVVALVVGASLLARQSAARRSTESRASAEPAALSEVTALTRTLVDVQIELARKKLAAGEPAEAMWRASRALSIDPGSSAAREVLATARETSDRLVQGALVEARAALARGDANAAATAFRQLLLADPNHPAASDLVPSLDAVVEAEAKRARAAMEEARQAAQAASVGQSSVYREGETLAHDGEAALAARTFAASARAFMQARDRFRRAMP